MGYNKYMKKILSTIIILATLIPNITFGAFAVPWSATSTSQGWVSPNTVNGINFIVRAISFIASSTTSSSIFPYASTTALSAGTLCLTADTCRTTWPTGGSSVGWASTTADINSIYFTGNNIGKAGIGSSSPYASLAVTNTGTSPSFVVEDSTSPDTTPFIIDASGNVGIGTTSPDIYSLGLTKHLTLSTNGASVSSASMLVAGGTTGRARLDLGNESILRAGVWGIDGSHLTFNTNASNSGTTLTEAMRITSGGNVGIGTTTPESLFNIRGSLPTFTITDTSNTSGSVGDSLSNINFVGEDTSSGLNGTVRASIGTYAADVFRAQVGLNFKTRNGATLYNRMVIEPNLGYVGIGTTTPTSKLTISLGATDSANGLVLDRVAGGASDNSARLFWVTDANNYAAVNFGGTLHFGSGGIPGSSSLASYVLSMDAAGDVGIGTSSPYAKLSVTNTTANPSFIVEDSTSPDTSPFIIDANGNVGVGTAAPSEKLSLYGASGLSRSMTLSNDTTYYKLLETLNYSGSDSYNMGLGGDIFLQYDGPAGNRTTTLGVNHASGEVIINGNVGIGTTATTYKLTVNNQIGFTGTGSGNAGNINWGTGYGNAALTLYDGGAGLRYVWGLNSAEMQFAIPSSVSARYTWNKGGDFQSSGTNEVMRLNVDTGNLGLGTTSPYRKLSIAGDAVVTDNVRSSYFTATSTTATSTIAGALKYGRSGIATLSSGTVTVTNIPLDSNAIIFLTIQNCAGTCGQVAVDSKTASSFVITSTSATDSSDVGWMVIQK